MELPEEVDPIAVATTPLHLGLGADVIPFADPFTFGPPFRTGQTCLLKHSSVRRTTPKRITAGGMRHPHEQSARAESRRTVEAAPFGTWSARQNRFVETPPSRL